MHVNNMWNVLLIIWWVQFFGKPYIKLLISSSIWTIWMVRTVNLYGAVRFHQCWSYLNNNCLLIDLPFLLELIHFLNFDFLVYLSSDDEMMEPQSSSTPRNAISTGMNCNECNSLSESFQGLKWLHNIFSLSYRSSQYCGTFYKTILWQVVNGIHITVLFWKTRKNMRPDNEIN